MLGSRKYTWTSLASIARIVDSHLSIIRDLASTFNAHEVDSQDLDSDTLRSVLVVSNSCLLDLFYQS